MISPERLQAVLKAAHEVHSSHWVPNAAVPEATQNAISITFIWQLDLVLDRTEYVAEYPVSGSKERFDLIDRVDRIVYELKTSGNNPHHEFYKDIFKIIVHNRNAPHDAFRHFVFLTTPAGVARLQTGMAQQIPQLQDFLGFTIQVLPIAAVA